MNQFSSRFSLNRIASAILGVSLFISCTLGADDIYDWKTVRMGGGGFVTGIIASKSEQGLRYARTDVGGAYR